MTEASRFLTSLAQAVSTMGLYRAGHPARERALDAAHERLRELQQKVPHPQFTFLGEEILMDQRPLRDLKSWDWGARFGAAGIQRLEFLGPVERDDLDVFLDEAYQRLSGARINTAEARQGRPSNIRYGAVGLRGEDQGTGTGAERILTARMGFSLQEEVSAVDWIHAELKDRRQLHMLEAESIVRSLSVAMHGDQAFVIPLLKLKDFDQYTTTHAMNVAILSMSLAEYIGLSPSEIRAFGISGLLHDLGKVTIPEEILNKPGKLTDEERAVMNAHPAEGARIILTTEDQLDLAATVAFEHHIKLNGGGYPTTRTPRRCHQASDMVHICDVFDALRTNRPYRDAWEQARVLSYLEEGAGTEFDPDLSRAFVQMMRSWEGRLQYVERAEESVHPVGTAEAAKDAPRPGEEQPSPPPAAAPAVPRGTQPGRESIAVAPISADEEGEDISEEADPSDALDLGALEGTDDDDMSWE